MQSVARQKCTSLFISTFKSTSSSRTFAPYGWHASQHTFPLQPTPAIACSPLDAGQTDVIIERHDRFQGHRKPAFKQKLKIDADIPDNQPDSTVTKDNSIMLQFCLDEYHEPVTTVLFQRQIIQRPTNTFVNCVWKQRTWKINANESRLESTGYEMRDDIRPPWCQNVPTQLTPQLSVDIWARRDNMLTVTRQICAGYQPSWYRNTAEVFTSCGCLSNVPK